MQYAKLPRIHRILSLIEFMVPGCNTLHYLFEAAMLLLTAAKTLAGE